ncbi:hypothetical protein [Nocardia aurantia]|uniref:Uncharacterized protein n=1 Tax=Nocardia aurantia TaxID=2585199 RepID=A0A7K0DP70_9NOCA|nr:hypothetical protein [Nocardia aurantia]MQY27519.1 hypothetical protein [Nocardia aurantia]
MPGSKGDGVRHAEAQVICAIHGPDCLAYVRADDRPDHILDFLDRQMKLFGSGHWDIKVTLNLLIVIAGVAICAAMVAFVLMSRAAQLAGGNPLQALVTGVLGISATTAVYRLRKHRAARKRATAELDRPMDAPVSE